MRKLLFAFLCAVDGAGITLLLEGLYAHDQQRMGFGVALVIFSTATSAWVGEGI